MEIGGGEAKATGAAREPGTPIWGMSTVGSHTGVIFRLRGAAGC